MAEKKKAYRPANRFISISVPVDLVEKLDRIGAMNNRTRSNFAAHLLKRLVADLEAKAQGK